MKNRKILFIKHLAQAELTEGPNGGDMNVDSIESVIMAFKVLVPRNDMT